MRHHKKVVWKTPGGTRPAGPPPNIPTRNILPLPSVVSFWGNMGEKRMKEWQDAYNSGQLFRVAFSSILTNAWGGTDAEEGQVAYMTGRNPTGRGSFHTVKLDSFAIPIGEMRVTEWDGKGWSRVLRPMFIIDGMKTAVVSARDLIPVT